MSLPNPFVLKYCSQAFVLKLYSQGYFLELLSSILCTLPSALFLLHKKSDPRSNNGAGGVTTGSLILSLDFLVSCSCVFNDHLPVVRLFCDETDCVIMGQRKGY